jgi:hypothetical protein
MKGGDMFAAFFTCVAHRPLCAKCPVDCEIRKRRRRTIDPPLLPSG